MTIFIFAFMEAIDIQLKISRPSYLTDEGTVVLVAETCGQDFAREAVDVCDQELSSSLVPSDYV